MARSAEICVRAFAKINLSLELLGTRADGYHELRTVFQSIALHDTLTIRRERGPLRLECGDPDVPTDGSNLIARAARAAWRASGRRGAPQDVVVALAKTIPVAAGLGGGSSDAAAALRALARVWRVDDERLPEIAASLGADVPYFLEGGTVLGVERGDVLFPLIDYPPAWVTLIVPAFGVSTKEAYDWFDRDRGPERAAPRPSDVGRPGQGRRKAGDVGRPGQGRRKAGDVGRPFQGRRKAGDVGRPGQGRRKADDVGRPFQGRQRWCNDLEPPVARRHPEIARIIGALRRQGASHAAMSGSGSAVFGLFERRGDAFAAATASAGRSRRVLVTRTLSRAEYRALAGK